MILLKKKNGCLNTILTVSFLFSSAVFDYYRNLSVLWGLFWQCNFCEKEFFMELNQSVTDTYQWLQHFVHRFSRLDVNRKNKRSITAFERYNIFLDMIFSNTSNTPICIYWNIFAVQKWVGGKLDLSNTEPFPVVNHWM